MMKSEMKQRKSNLKHCFLQNIDIRRSALSKNQAILCAGKQYFRCAIGKNGMSAFKREGDGKTPIAKMRIISGFQKPTRRIRPACSVVIKIMGLKDGWCDEANDRNYNRPVKLPYPASCETMLRKDCLYNIGFILDYNIRPRQKNRGSAIFFHLARENYSGTQGCIALSQRDMLRLLPFLSTKTRLNVVG